MLSKVFRGKFLDGLKCLFRHQKLTLLGSLQWLQEPRAFARFLHGLHRHGWVISNHRLLGMENGKVTFRWKDYAHGGKQRKMTLAAEEFIRRFLLHVLPKGFVRIRHYGWMANRCRRESAALCRALLGEEAPQPAISLDRPAPPLCQCPFCGGAVEVIETIVPRELSRYRKRRTRELDTS